MKNQFIYAIIVLLFTGYIANNQICQADTLVLNNGGRLEGTILNPAGTQAPETYQFKTTSGIKLEISANQVNYVVSPGGANELYDKKVQLMADSVEGHLAMATWCQLNKLPSLEDRHYRRVLELDTNNAVARKALGYIQRDGVWTTRDEMMTDQGMVKYEGRWIYSQEKDLIEKRKENKQSSNVWKKQINQWQSELFGRKTAQAEAGLRSIKDPNAVPALATVLFSDKRDSARLLYISILGALGTPDAMRVLGQCAMNDPVEEVRLSCLDELKKHQATAAVDYFATELKSKINPRVNRAGELIGEIGDLNAVPQLIPYLTTKHKYKISGGPGMSASQGNDGAAGMVMGGGDKIVEKLHQNQSVLDALRKITKQDFGFDKSAWTVWYSKNKQGGTETNLRRQ